MRQSADTEEPLAYEVFRLVLDALHYQFELPYYKEYWPWDDSERVRIINDSGWSSCHPEDLIYFRTDKNWRLRFMHAKSQIREASCNALRSSAGLRELRNCQMFHLERASRLEDQDDRAKLYRRLHRLTANEHQRIGRSAVCPPSMSHFGSALTHVSRRASTSYLEWAIAAASDGNFEFDPVVMSVVPGHPSMYRKKAILPRLQLAHLIADNPTNSSYEVSGYYDIGEQELARSWLLESLGPTAFCVLTDRHSGNVRMVQKLLRWFAPGEFDHLEAADYVTALIVSRDGEATLSEVLEAVAVTAPAAYQHMLKEAQQEARRFQGQGFRKECEAAGLVHEALAKLVQHGAYDKLVKSTSPAYFYIKVIGYVQGTLRARSKADNSIEFTNDTVASNVRSAHDEACRMELMHVFEEELRRLKPEDQDLVRRRLLSDEPWADIAEDLGTNVNALTTRYSRILNKIAQSGRLRELFG